MTEFEGKPGTALAAIIPQWAVDQKKTDCSCENEAAQMDKWGVEGCIENKSIIVERLAQKRKYLRGILASTPEWVCKAMAEKMVDHAIDMARAN